MIKRVLFDDNTYMVYAEEADKYYRDIDKIL